MNQAELVVFTWGPARSKLAIKFTANTTTPDDSIVADKGGPPGGRRFGSRCIREAISRVLVRTGSTMRRIDAARKLEEQCSVNWGWVAIDINLFILHTDNAFVRQDFSHIALSRAAIGGSLGPTSSFVACASSNFSARLLHRSSQ